MLSPARHRRLKAPAAWLAMVALALLTPPRVELSAETDGATIQRRTYERPALALPDAQVERVVTPVKVAPRAMQVLPATTAALRAVSDLKHDARPVERGAWRGVKWARLRACPPQGPPSPS
ncbi:MAG: hypothetical protein ACO1OB_18425 [Archangium sp.]